MWNVKRLLPVLILLAGLTACNLEDPEVGINSNQVITLQASQSSMPADGISQLTLTATLGPESDPNKAITFRTDQGTFAGANAASPTEITVTASGKVATANLIASTTISDNVLVSANVGGYNATQNIVFNRALPESMLFSSNLLTINTNGTDFATLTVQLFRNIGAPSNETQVFFELAPQDTALGITAPFALSFGNSATATLRSQNGLPGLVKVTAKTLGAAGDTLRQTLDLRFQ